ncbi:uncharacterized protein COLE_00605 [Cutaneotrichosporon oleaginosum]|uniref:uncharacterized protein n=1 Tax=Cutaneotrichosporon oleaginosum TaxID=879819 RepID=UPI00132A7D6B|nr:hypothetical protein COLE_00605 [Cutaneotrichosporon oleaginosum]
MPVTKKKGAIFAVYADTPPRAGPAPKEPSQPREGRRALTNIEPAPTRRKASPEGKRRALAPRSPSRSTRSKMDVFVDTDAVQTERPRRALAARPLSTKLAKPLSNTSMIASAKAPSSKPLAAKSVLNQPNASSSSFEPSLSKHAMSKPSSSKSAARPRAALVKRARSPTDKENAAPPDSPASRTRSKLVLPKPSIEKKPMKKSSRAFTVFVDPLADVSEAYGASGDEPAGFPAQGRSSIVSAPLIRSLIAALLVSCGAARYLAER